MIEKKTTTFANGLIWFGAAVSIAEILTGTLLAPLGFARGLAAILLGHLIGGLLFFLAGLIGGQTGRSAMETVKLSFGEKGSRLFSSLNVLQLVGWTAVMIVSGAAAAGAIIDTGGNWIWSLVIGGLIIVWLLIGIKELTAVNIITMSGLFILTLVLSGVIFKSGGQALADQAQAQIQAQAAGPILSFGGAVELAVAMPLSWLPLIADYTSQARRPFAATLTSTLIYGFGSCWMYVIGLGAALFTGESDVAAIMVKAGLGIIGLIIILFSTVTTTYLDAYSAGVSSKAISAKIKEKPSAIAVCILGTALAILTPIAGMTDFLYLIGSVFAPMAAILITDYFILKNDKSAKGVDWLNILLWLTGFIIYRWFMGIDTPVGNTLPVMVITGLLCILSNLLANYRTRGVEKNV